MWAVLPSWGLRRGVEGIPHLGYAMYNSFCDAIDNARFEQVEEAFQKR